MPRAKSKRKLRDESGAPKTEAASARKSGARKRSGATRAASKPARTGSGSGKKSAPKARVTKARVTKQSAKKRAVPKVRAQTPGSRRRPAQPESDLAFRLDGSMRARAYRLHVEVAPEQSDRYTGRVEIDVSLDRELRRFELHAADLELQSARVRSTHEQTASIELHPERETCSLEVPESVAPGEITLELTFAGQLRSDLRGLYGARSGEHNYAFTQLQAADARRFFPCLDEPDQKARFALSVTTSSDNFVVSNSPVEQSIELDGGQKRLTFAQTPLLSSYLVALGVGQLVASEPVYAGETPIRVVHVPGNEHMTSFALEAARESLTRLAAYFDLPYPYAKLDLVAVPDFEIGAMENAGAVFFRETLLLIDESQVSLAEKKRAAEVIAHELAHMWYGNLVTMRWWDDLWLNEAFATWMAFDIVAGWKPEWHMWNDFAHARNSALQLDALANTHPIYTEVRTPSEATENFDLITYEKGAAVVRMVERYLGPEVFQAGVRRYIKRHSESNTVASDLWNALSEAAGENVENVVRPFVEQPGFPLVRVTRDAKAGRVLLKQERFVAEAAGAGKRGSNGRALWAVPWVGRAGSDDAELERHLLRKASERVQLALPDAPYLYGNADEGGFFRPLHDRRDMPALLEALPELAVTERIGFVQHQWALVRAGYTELTDFLPLVPALAHEPEADVLRSLLPPLEHLLDDVALSAGPELHAQLQAFLIETFGPALKTLGWDSARGEPHGVRLRRSELLQLVAVLAESDAASDAAEERFVSYMRERTSIDPNLIAPVLCVGARRADAARLSQLLDASEHADTPQARRRFRLASADVRDPSLAGSLLLECLGPRPRIPTQDVAFVVARLLRNPHVQEHTFEFIQTRWNELRERIPAMLMSRVIEAAPALRSETHRKTIQRFFAKHPLPTAARALRQTDERFRLDARFRKRVTPDLRKFLRARTRSAPGFSF